MSDAAQVKWNRRNGIMQKGKRCEMACKRNDVKEPAVGEKVHRQNG